MEMDVVARVAPRPSGCDDDDVIFVGENPNRAATFACDEILFPASPDLLSNGESETKPRGRGRPRGKRKAKYGNGRAREKQTQTVVKTEERCCVLCLDTDRPALGTLDRVGARGGRRGHQSLWVHSDCLYYASRRTEDEAGTDLFSRVIHHALLCKRCRKKRASVGCRVNTCTYICHYPCAIESGGDYIENEGFYCPQHVHLAKKKMLELCRWPKECPVRFTSVNLWDDISKEDLDFIARHHNSWEEYTPSFLSQNLTTKVYVQEIFFGHWAYCTNLRKRGIEKQYEVRALVDIEKDEMIGEYVGRVRYQKDITDSHYVANFWYPEGILDDVSDKQLCLDAEYEGNEMRFVNSVAPTTAFYIKQNATMSTVWCRNQLRVVMTATRNILKDQPIIVNYNEFSSSFFEENLPFLPRFTINLPPIPPQVLACGKKSALAQYLHPTSDETKETIKQEDEDEEEEEEGAAAAKSFETKGVRKAKRRRRTTDDDSGHQGSSREQGRHKHPPSSNACLDPLVDVIVLD